MSQVLEPIKDGVLGHRLVGLFHPPWFVGVSASSVLSSEWVEGGQLNPSGAHLVISFVSEETTSVWAYKWHTEHIHVHDSGDGVVHVCPLSTIIAKPVLSILTRSNKGAPAQNEGSIIGVLRDCVVEEEFTSPLRFHVSKQRVNIKFSETVAGVGGVERHRLVVKVILPRHKWQFEGAHLILLGVAGIPGRV